MMDIYVKMEMITNRVLHFHYRKVVSEFLQYKIVEILKRGKFLCCQIHSFIDCRDTEWKTEENFSVENCNI